MAVRLSPSVVTQSAAESALPDPVVVPRASAPALESFGNLKYSRADLTDVLQRFAVGDWRSVLEIAAEIDDGDGILQMSELVAAGRKATEYSLGNFQARPWDLAEVMKAHDLKEETAILRLAKRADDGDRILGTTEFEHAATILKSVVRPNDVYAILARLAALNDGQCGVHVETIGEVPGYPIVAAHFPVLSSEPPALAVCITGGVHGDEPSGAGAAIFLAEWLARCPAIRQHVEFTVIPMVNPRGLAASSRETPDGIDVNRTCEDEATAPEESQSVMRLLSKRPYDLGIDLHSGARKRNGFWVIHREALDLLTPVLDSFDDEYPVLHGDVAPYQLERPGILVSENRGTLKDLFVKKGARWAVTVEAPKSLSYLDQVMGEVDLAQRIVGAALGAMSAPPCDVIAFNRADGNEASRLKQNAGAFALTPA